MTLGLADQAKTFVSYDEKVGSEKKPMSPPTLEPPQSAKFLLRVLSMAKAGLRIMEKSGQGGTEVPPIQRRRLRESIRRPRWIVAVVMTAIVVIVVLLALVPVSRTATFNFGSSESGSAITRFDSSGYWAVCPSGSRMTVAFASTGLNVTFSITAPTGTTIWEQHAAYANVSFSVPACGTYLINAEGAGNGTFSVVATLSYSAPLL